MSLYLDIHKKFSGFNLDVSFNIKNESLAILGASGCGKSLTLKSISGIIKPDTGQIILDNNILFDSDKKINLPTQERKTGLMFQNYALFPNMTVEQNIRISCKNKSEIFSTLERFGLDCVKNLYPSQISGGQQQRTALARMLLSRPDIIMLDEPLSALDSHLRFQMERELLNIFTDFEGSIILVSHNRDEVFRLCDKIAIFNNGQVENFGTKQEIFNNPLTKNAAILTGCKNISRAEIINGQIYALDWDIMLKCKNFKSDTKFIGVRMHSIINESSKINCFDCKVIQVIENPFSITVMLIPLCANKNISPIGWEVDKNLWQQIKSDIVKISIPPENLLMLKE